MAVHSSQWRVRSGACLGPEDPEAERERTPLIAKQSSPEVICEGCRKSQFRQNTRGVHENESGKRVARASENLEDCRREGTHVPVQ